MWLHKRFFVIVTISVIAMFPIIKGKVPKPAAQPAPQPAQQVAELTRQVAALKEQLSSTQQEINKDMHGTLDKLTRAIHKGDELGILVATAARKAIKARTDTIDANEKIGALAPRIEQVQGLLAELEERSQNTATNFGQLEQAAGENLERTAEQVIEKISAHAEDAEKLLVKSIDEAFKKNNNPELEKEKAKIIGDSLAKAYLDGIEKNYEGMQKLIPKIVVAIIVIALCIYILKYGLPVLINYLTQPRIISETSRPGLFEWFKQKQIIDIDDLIFTPILQKQLLDLLLRVQTAKEFNEPLPNVLFYGAPGTGKTAFVKALAYLSGLDYALTSGSEFAKITDLNHANNELRKLLKWAKRSKNGLIVFIDEAESLFANRKLAMTSKATQDFINTFLSLVSDQSQKKVMFIFSTNHPFKLDDAITNRIGINIEFTLPESAEREKILSMYLVKAAQENEDAVVDLHPDLAKLIPKYAESLKGFSPRAIKFIAEEMIISARRQEPMQLTNDIALAAINQAKRSLQQTSLWEKEREEWEERLNVIHAF